MVAKSYQGLEIVGQPFEQGGRMYVTVRKNGSTKQVRWYSDAEYDKLYPVEMKKIRPVKDVLGFTNGYITIFKGNTEPLQEWFEQSAATYHVRWGWNFASTVELPPLPAGIEPLQLKWEDVADVAADELKPPHIIEAAVNKLIYGDSASKYQGAIGDRIELELTVKKVLMVDGYFGISSFHVFTDASGNEYVWSTTARTLEEGATYRVKGSIRDHNLFHGIEQTILTRCKCEKI